MTYLNKTLKISKQSFIKLDCVSFDYDRVVALKDISLDIKMGEFTYLIGPNGGGKSTLIKIISGLLKPISGQAIILTDEIGYMPQALTPKHHLPITVSEIIYSGFTKQSLMISKVKRAIIDEWLQKMNISELKNQLFSNLSGGELQRVLLARALVSNPKLLILDEPTSALDPSFKETFYNLLQTLNQNGVAILFVTHDMDHIKNSNHVIYLNQEIAFQGLFKDYLVWKGSF